MSHIARELKMLFYLNNNINRHVKIDELSDLLEVTPRQVRRYRDDLEQNGYFIDELRGPAGGYKLSEPLDKSLMIPDNIMLALNVSAKNNESLIKSLKELPVTSKFKEIVAGDNNVFDDQLEKLTIITKAINETKTISFDYPVKGKIINITINPYRILYTNHSYYIRACNDYVKDLRSFDVDKMDNIKILNSYQIKEEINKRVDKELSYYGLKDGENETKLTLEYDNEITLKRIDRLFEYKGIIDKNNKTYTVLSRSENELYYPLFSLGTSHIKNLNEDFKIKYIEYLNKQLDALKKH